MAGATLRDGKGKFETRTRVVKNAGEGGAAGDRRERDRLPLGPATGGNRIPRIHGARSANFQGQLSSGVVMKPLTLGLTSRARV